MIKVYLKKLSLQECTEKAMAPHSSTLAWKIPWTEEPGRLQSMGSRRVGHDWETSLSLFLSCTGEGNGNPLQYSFFFFPLQYSCLENPRDGEAWWAAVYGVAQSRTRLKWLSSSSKNALCDGLFTSYVFGHLHYVQFKQSYKYLQQNIPFSIC